MSTTDPSNVPDFSGQMMLDGRLHLMQQLGAGAFGAVYHAREYALGRPLREVAVKLTHQAGLSREEARNHLQEGYTLASIAAGCRDARSRRHLIQVYDMGLAEDLDGRAYMVMEFVPGTLLMRHIRAYGASMPMSMARRYFRELCYAVAACHRHDPPISHGDLKPDNVLVDQSHSIRVVDFGLARPIERLTGYAVSPGGCMAYCAPETLLGQATPRADIYSLGLIMHELLAGDGPHLQMPDAPIGDKAWHYYQQKQKLEFPELGEMNQSLAPDRRLFEVVARCCQFHEEDRYRSLDEVLEALSDTDDQSNTDDADGPIPRSTTDARSPSQLTTAANLESTATPWQQRARRYFDLEDFTGGLKFIQSLSAAADDSDLKAWRAIFLARCGRREEGIETGRRPLENRSLPSPLRNLLAVALFDAATGLAETDSRYAMYAEYLKSKMSE